MQIIAEGNIAKMKTTLAAPVSFNAPIYEIFAIVLVAITARPAVPAI